MIDLRAPAVEAIDLAAHRAALALLEHPRMTEPQRNYCGHDERFFLWRGGNSIGKSYAHAWDDIHFLRGTHPWRKVPKPPVKILIGGFSFAQMDPLLEKLWMMLPKGEIDPKIRYVPGQGIQGYKQPVIPIVAGPGRGSMAFIVTYEQGGDRIKGFQGHRVSLDEPPPQHVYSEAVPRLNRFRGEMRITFTPTLDSPPLEYLEKEVKEGRVREMQTSYTQENCTIRGGLAPWAWVTQSQIDEDLAQYLADELPMRRDGAWDPVLVGRWLSEITDDHFTDDHLPAGQKWYLGVGVDHGTRPGRNCATLVACDELGEDFWILDEVWAEDQVTTTRDDARGILKMLARNGIRWDEVDVWVGDRATAESFFGDAKSNQDLMDELARELGMTRTAMAAKGLRIETAFKPGGSPRRGVAVMNNLARKGKLRIRRAARGFDQARKEWRGEKAHPLKDCVDSARYVLTRLRDQRNVRLGGGSGRYQ